MRFECVLAKDKKKPLIINNDTPMESISQELVNDSKEDKKDLYEGEPKVHSVMKVWHLIGSKGVVRLSSSSL